jgi:predicted HTH domain antitoxin
VNGFAGKIGLERFMRVQFDFSAAVLQEWGLSEAEAEARVRLEFAAYLYGRRMVSFGKAAELAGVGREELAEALGRLGVDRDYGPEELAQDIAYVDRE